MEGGRERERERERERTSRGGAEKEGDKRIQSGLCADSSEPDMGPKLTSQVFNIFLNVYLFLREKERECV